MLSLSLHLLFQGISCFPGFPSYYCFLCRNPFILRWYPVLPGVLHAVSRVVRGGWGGRGGPHVARKRLQPCTCCYLGVKFNLPSLFTIPGPILAPFPAGDWVSNLRGSSVSRTLQWKLQCFRLPTPVLAKGVLTFSLPWLDSIEIARLGLLPIVFCPLKEQMARNVSVSCDSGYCAYLSWSFPTWPGVMSLARTFMYLCQNNQAWRQRWCQLDDPINLGSSRPPCVLVLVTTLTYLYLGYGTALMY